MYKLSGVICFLAYEMSKTSNVLKSIWTGAVDNKNTDLGLADNFDYSSVIRKHTHAIYRFS